MARREKNDYFQMIADQVTRSRDAAQLLNGVLTDFRPELLPANRVRMHEIEHEADLIKHDMIEKLIREFITPIEREDIMQLSQCIDEITDKIEDVVLRIYYNNVRSIQPDALELTGVVIRCCEAVRDLLAEFADFKHAKKMHEHIVRINTMEEEADRRYIASMRALHTTCSDPLVILSWREIYIYLEKCADACEHVADVVEGVIMKNS